MKETVTVSDLRKRLKAAGYKLKVQSLSFGRSGSVLDADGNKMPSIFTSETKAHWQAAIDIVHNLNVVTDDTDKVYGPWSAKRDSDKKVVVRAVAGEEGDFDTEEVYGFVLNELENAGILAYIQQETCPPRVIVSGLVGKAFNADRVYDFIFNELENAGIRVYIAVE